MNKYTEISTSAVINWEQYADDYDKLTLLRPYNELLQYIAQHCHTADPCARVLVDAACGVGSLWQFLNSGFQVVGYDNSLHMIEKAKTNSRFLQDLSLYLHDLSLGLPPERFDTADVVVSSNTLYALPSKELFVSSCYKSLKPGGRLILVDILRGADNGLILKSHARSSKPDSYWRDLHETPDREKILINEAFSHHVDAIEFFERICIHNRLIDQSNFTFYSRNMLEELVRDVGFTLESSALVYADQALCITATK